ncbi:hypothetical protein [Azonexus sp.]|uniref:hypothetical protein n=1 Tax=Azonexus sp. TaxID=1872668 RepID=UPI0039E6F7DB
MLVLSKLDGIITLSIRHRALAATGEGGSKKNDCEKNTHNYLLYLKPTDMPGGGNDHASDQRKLEARAKVASWPFDHVKPAGGLRENRTARPVFDEHQ